MDTMTGQQVAFVRRGGGLVRLVVFPDGRTGVIRDRRPPHVWEMDAEDDCLRTFFRLAGADGSAAGDGGPEP